MARKNNRSDEVPPLDVEKVILDIDAAPIVSTYRRRETDDERNARLDAEYRRRRQRNARRADKRIADILAPVWKTCCVPGCEEPNAWWYERQRHDTSTTLPICERHLVLIANQAQPDWQRADIYAMRQNYARQWVEVELANERKWDVDDENGGHEQGQIYFVRLNGIVKVGWSKKLRSRLKAYGASAEILCHYPATRDDETNLHRNLRLYLAMGREWYQDCKLIADVIDGVIKQYGEPSIFPDWTVPKPEVVAGKRHAS